MEQNKVTGPVLAIDSVSRQGSIAVIRGASLLASSEAMSGNPARAEELLPLISNILETAEMELRDLVAVAVATGPGSYSGIRIGMATAIGFSSACNIPILGVSLLEGLTMTVNSGTVMAAVRAGKHDVAYEEFKITDDGPRSISPPVQDSETNFVSHLGQSSRVVACESELATHLASRLSPNVDLLSAGENLATLIGQFAFRFPDRSHPQPLYLRSVGHKTAGF